VQVHDLTCTVLQTELCICMYVWDVRMGEVACCEEIKAFIAKHNIKQQQIASLAGKSLPLLLLRAVPALRAGTAHFVLTVGTYAMS